MTNTRQHLARRFYGRDGSGLVCMCGKWKADRTQTIRKQRTAHRAHRVEMGETVAPLQPTRDERLAFAEAALARLRTLAEGWVALASIPGATLVDATRFDCGRKVLAEIEDATESEEDAK
ncbi:hypothetical protein ACFY05_32050 [Microtetraspora fusca]|uniref:Uncharacterized protein n=1 Tax=Microtetraspora fusca TaxID=1997 RepID=A0ABW6VDT1_MICFU